MALISNELTQNLQDVGLIAATLIAVMTVTGMIFRWVMKQFLRWLVFNIRSIIKEELVPIKDELKDAKDNRNTMVEILREIQPLVSELKENTGSTMKDKVDGLYKKMLHDEN
jgi:F0F1-type ATP synthase membrane subunit b/b'